MRVAVVDPPSYTVPYDHSLAAALGRRGHDVELLTSHFLFGTAPDPDGYRRDELFFPLSGRLLGRTPRSPLRLLVKGAEYGPSVRRLVRRVEELDPDVVHIQWLALPRYDLRWLRRLARRYPTVLTAHDVVPRKVRRVELWLEVLRTVDRVVVHSRRAVRQLVELGIEEDRVVTIPHPVFDAPPGRTLAPPRGRTLLFFGLLRHYKGLDLLVRALPSVARRVPDVRLVIAGDPVEPVEFIRALAGELGVADRIEWRLEFVPDPEIPELMERAAALVLPYRKIDSSGVLATAFGHGRPVVVSDVGSLGELVRDFDAGVVVPPEDVPALADGCVALLTDETALAEAYRGTQRAREALTWDAAALEHERLYETVVRTSAR